MDEADPHALNVLPPLREVIARHGLRAEKALGQNFLLDGNITDKIVRAAGDLTGMTVVEIGPGPGGLTRSLLKSAAAKVVAVEYDSRAVVALQELREVAGVRLEIVHADALKTDLISLVPEARRAIIANLPYNIATPLLIGWLRQMREQANACQLMLLMFQCEVADRLTAKPGTKEYGRLSVMAQWLCHVETVFDLPPSVFVPAPKVTSSIVRFVPREMDIDAPAFGVMEDVVGEAFGQRRKMIRSSLKSFLPYVEEAGIDQALRAENLSVADYVRIAKALSSGREQNQTGR